MTDQCRSTNRGSRCTREDMHAGLHRYEPPSLNEVGWSWDDSSADEFRRPEPPKCAAHCRQTMWQPDGFFTPLCERDQGHTGYHVYQREVAGEKVTVTWEPADAPHLIRDYGRTCTYTWFPDNTRTLRCFLHHGHIGGHYDRVANIWF